MDQRYEKFSYPLRFRVRVSDSGRALLSRQPMVADGSTRYAHPWSLVDPWFAIKLRTRSVWSDDEPNENIQIHFCPLGYLDCSRWSDSRRVYVKIV